MEVIGDSEEKSETHSSRVPWNFQLDVTALKTQEEQEAADILEALAQGERETHTQRERCIHIDTV